MNREIQAPLLKSAKSRPCVLLTGARQTGKSSLLKKIFKNHNYISLDLPYVAREAKENGTWFLEKHPPPLIIDEIQYAPELFRFLKVKIDSNRTQFNRYILSGSQKFSLMRGVRESLSGRVALWECHSLSVRELFYHKKMKKFSSSQVLDWMIKGGYPEVYSQKLRPERFYADYLATYLERDVRQLVHVRDLYSFNKFLRLLAIRSGQMLSMHSLATDVGVSSHTIKSWISILEAGNIIYLLRPFYNNYGKRLIKSPKLYFLDTGLLCFLAGIHTTQALADSSLLGSFFETLCLGQMLKHFSGQGLPVNLYYYRDQAGYEVDFIIPEGHKLSLYECKWRFESDHLPASMQKAITLFGPKNVKMAKVLTSSFDSYRLKKNHKVTHLISL